MRKLLATLAAIIAFGGGALGSIFVGGELVPFHYGPNAYAKPFLTIGAYFPMDTWGPCVTFGSDTPLVPDGWYFVAVEGDKKVSKAGYLGIGSAFYLDFKNFAIKNDSTWTIYFKGGVTLAKHLDGYIKFNIPLKADPAKPLFGSWISLGLDYWFDFGGEAKVAEG